MEILFLQAGGTIDKAYPSGEMDHGYSFEITEPAFDRILARVKPAFKYATKTVVQKDSLDMTDEDRLALLDACQAAPEERIIITHGTDTMLKTAEVLSRIAGKTIVLTGALSPEKFKDSDADFQLGTAVGAVAVLAAGVYIAMNGNVLPWDQITFDDESGRFVPK